MCGPKVILWVPSELEIVWKCDCQVHRIGGNQFPFRPEEPFSASHVELPCKTSFEQSLKKKKIGLEVTDLNQHLYVTEEENETQRDKVTMPRSQSPLVAGLKQEPHPPHFLSSSFPSWVNLLKATYCSWNTRLFLAYYLGRKIGRLSLSNQIWKPSCLGMFQSEENWLTRGAWVRQLWEPNGRRQLDGAHVTEIVLTILSSVRLGTQEILSPQWSQENNSVLGHPVSSFIHL